MAEQFSDGGQESVAGVNPAGMSNSFDEIIRSVGDIVKDLPGQGREAFRAIDGSARSNPWLHIGAFGAGGLLLGYLLGRGSNSSHDIQGSMRKYEEFDDALDE